MTTVSIKELHERTGHWLRRVGEEQEVIVTDRGRPIARLVPEPAPFAPDAELAKALARSLEPSVPSLPPACVDELGLEFP